MEVGDLILMIEIVTILIVVLAALSITLFYIDKNRKLKQGQEILRSQLEIQEQSFENIYKEIHDNIGQALSLAKLNLHTTEANLPERTNEKINLTKELIAKAITDLRNLSRSLNPEVITKIGLNEAVKQELLIIDKDGRYQTRLSERGNPFRLDEQKELIIFRIFQEHLNNIVTYSQAKTVNVELEYQPEHLSLAVSDDGQEPVIREHKQGYSYTEAAICNMRNRASLIGAVFHITTIIGGGTKIFIELPMK